MKYELCIYSSGSAVLSDPESGEVVWSSDSDDEFAKEFDEVLTIEDDQAIVDYLEEADYVEEDSDVDVVEDNEELLEDDEDEDDEDDEDDSPGFFE